MTAIILAGGFGTRLQSVVRDVPKPMADINGKPFLEYLFQYLSKYNISDVVLSVGYKQEIIKDYFGNKYKNINIKYSCEDTPLGTGGAIKKAFSLIETDDSILVINGDTFFDVNLDNLTNKTIKNNFDIVMSLKELKDFDRYGSVIVEDNIIMDFQEKKFITKGYINCGVYVIRKQIFDNMEALNNFSFEEFLKSNLSNLAAYSHISNDSYFIDIGIPDDYTKAQIDFKEIF